MKQLLIVSYDFPPSSIGIWRTLKYCRYMPHFGWQASILTVKTVRSPRHDDGPLGELPPGTEIRRTASLDPARLSHIAAERRARKTTAPPATGGKTTASAPVRGIMDILRRWIFIPDERIGWYPFAVRDGLTWIRQRKFDAIYSTSFPHTAHLVGARLAHNTGLPLLADFRDSWTGNYEFFKPATPLHSHLQHRMEARVIRTAARVVTATRPITEDFIARYPNEPAAKFHTITNGYDPADYPEVLPHPDREHFTISFVGTMFGDASPENFLRGVRTLLEHHPALREILRLRFVGSMIPPYRAMIDEHGLQHITSVESYVPHDEALRAMAEADALLLIVPDVPGAQIMLTQKVFEYAAARRPIIGLVPEGAARDFLQEINEGPIIHPRDTNAVEARLLAMIEQWKKNGRQPLPTNPALEKYHRKNLTASLCTLLNQLVPSQE